MCEWKTQIQGLNVESILDAPHFLGWTCLVNTSASMADHDHLNPWMDGTRPVDSGSSHSQQNLLFPQKARGEIETALQRCYRLLSTYSCASNNWLDLRSNAIWEKTHQKNVYDNGVLQWLLDTKVVLNMMRAMTTIMVLPVLQTKNGTHHTDGAGGRS